MSLRPRAAIGAVIWALSCSAFAGCRPSDPAPLSAASGAPTTTTPAGFVGVVQKPHKFDGRCATARPLGALSNYRHLLATKAKTEVRVRSTPMWSAANLSNVIGKLAGGTTFPAWGPLKERPSNGIGYAIPLRDGAGKLCRGYLSYTVVEVRACDHFASPAGFKAFPQPLDVTPGPCSVQR